MGPMGPWAPWDPWGPWAHVGPWVHMGPGPIWAQGPYGPGPIWVRAHKLWVAVDPTHFQDSDFWGGGEGAPAAAATAAATTAAHPSPTPPHPPNVGRDKISRKGTPSLRYRHKSCDPRYSRLDNMVYADIPPVDVAINHVIC